MQAYSAAFASVDELSNTFGEYTVASMSVLINGEKSTSHYRKFKIKSFVGQDDYRSMSEVIERRFNEYNKGTDEAFSIMPDLILLDGGKGQLSSVTQKLDEMGINIAVFGMVKDTKHQTNAIVSENGKITIKQNRSAYTLIPNIQNEVHRFAIGYHRQKRHGAGAGGLSPGHRRPPCGGSGRQHRRTGVGISHRRAPTRQELLADH